MQLHCEVHGLPTTMISTFDIHKLEADCGHSIWTHVDGNRCCIETEQILDTVVYSDRPDGKVAVLLPLEYR